MKASFRQILLTIVIVLVVFGVMHTTVQSFEVDGSSMEPSFSDNQYLLVDKVTYRFGSPDRGDVIIFHPPTAPNKLYIKRVIGLPGEKVEIKEEKIYIDDKELEEIPDFYPTTYQGDSIIVPEDHYFVLGDNRNNSGDSRLGWTVPGDQIVGKVWIRYWPPGDWGLSPSYSYTLE